MKNKKIIILITNLCFLIFFIPLSQAEDVYLSIGNGFGSPGSKSNPVTITLDNSTDRIKGLQVDIYSGGYYLSCKECEPIGRASDFFCLVNRPKSGCTRVILYSVGDLIEEGKDPILIIYFDIAENAPPGQCINLDPKNAVVSDENKNSLEVTAVPGEFCFVSNLCTLEYLYGENSDKIHLLKDYRDKILGKTPQGQAIISLYYNWNPLIVKAIKEDGNFKKEVEALIDGVLPLIEMSLNFHNSLK